MSDLCSKCGTPRYLATPKNHRPFYNTYEGTKVNSSCSFAEWGDREHNCWTCRCGNTWQLEVGYTAENKRI